MLNDNIGKKLELKKHKKQPESTRVNLLNTILRS
jgi:hypothetical protein